MQPPVPWFQSQYKTDFPLFFNGFLTFEHEYVVQGEGNSFYF
jgi:hypothetical protein